MSDLAIALLDAAKNCALDDATAVLTLRSGRELSGKLEAPPSAARTAHVTHGGGWSTVRISEIAAVTAVPKGGT